MIQHDHPIALRLAQLAASVTPGTISTMATAHALSALAGLFHTMSLAAMLGRHRGMSKFWSAKLTLAAKMASRLGAPGR